jgi:hypothetical protein
MARVRIPEPASAGVLLSYKCSAACRHCMYACSPAWSADWISLEDLETLLTLLAGKIRSSPWGPAAIGLNHGLHFTGGEPFLNFDLLVEAVSMAEATGIPSTFVETNCFWCHQDTDTRSKLELLKVKGLKGILISVNPYYAEFVPFERTERCILASLEVFGRNVIVYQLEYLHRFKQLGIKERISVDDYQRLANDESLADCVELFLMGRATRELRGMYPRFPARKLVPQPCQPEFLRSWHNHFDNYLDTLVSEGLDRKEYPVLDFLIDGNMKGLLQFAQDRGYQELAAGYLSKCDLCLDIRKYLMTRGSFAELQPVEFYEHVG